jgi:hypothetical protein
MAWNISHSRRCNWELWVAVLVSKSAGTKARTRACRNEGGIYSPNFLTFSLKKPLFPIPPVQLNNPEIYPVPVTHLYANKADYKGFRQVRYGPREWTFYGTIPYRSH